MDKGWYDTDYDYEKHSNIEEDDTQVPKFNPYQKAEEKVYELYEEIREVLHDMCERDLLRYLETSDVAELLYSKDYLDEIVKTAEGPRSF